MAVHTYSHEDVTSLEHLPRTLLDQVEEFFISYNKSRGKKFQVDGRHGPKRAGELVEAGMKVFKKKHRS